MGIKSSVKEQKVNRVIDTKQKDIDFNENSLRPKTIGDYVGQTQLKKHLGVSIASAKMRKATLEHILFYGPPGLGKTTLCNIIANEMQANIKTTSGPAIEKQADLVSILSNLESGDILFIDEIHRLRPQIEEVLYTAMEDFVIDIVVGKGTGAQGVRMPVNNFSLVGATTKLSSLSSPLRDRFGNVMKLDFYNDEELFMIIKNNSKLLNLELGDNIISQIAKRSRGTPRITNRLLKIVRDYTIIGHNLNDEKVCENIFNDLGIDDKGLDYLDKKYLDTINSKFGGGPVGLSTIASSIGEEESTIEDVVEPYLLQIGFIQRSPRGRIITDLGLKHLKNII
ncbi:MAG: Holliday junction branch migration DNA helicase RuvB [Candidatus Gracilibacteria bacterium]|nr:Holliday junction branch migration DNA helicase RuvB [Candidatus Gracilibacteria bacterium]